MSIMSEASSKTVSTSAPNSPLEISVQEKKVCYQQEQTLLESLEQANVEVHFHCRDGFCGACRVKLNSGEICYPQGEPLAFIGENEILPCCCIPITNISITIDE